VLSSTGFGNDTAFAHSFDQQPLSHHIIGLVCSGVIQVFTFAINLKPTSSHLRKIIEPGHGSRPAGIGLHDVYVFFPELWVSLCFLESLDEFVKGRGQDFWNEFSSIITVVTGGIGS